MSHKGDKSFFNKKHEWSKRKDAILRDYLPPYLLIVQSLRKPILLVDGFAGPGKFGDGLSGSPLIICEAVNSLIDEGKKKVSKIEVLCIEDDADLCAALNENLMKYPFATQKSGTFLSFTDELSERAKEETVFLYLDPFAIEGLQWSSLEKVFQRIQNSHSSVEMLLNFNSPAFARRGLAALKLSVPRVNPEIEDDEEIEFLTTETPSIEKLNAVVGGDWWQHVLLANDGNFQAQVRQLAEGLKKKLLDRFKEVCFLPVKAKETHDIPKYWMIFASRSPKALRLMNDVMVKARGASLVTYDLVAPLELEQLILEESSNPAKRQYVIEKVMRRSFCVYKYSDIRGGVETLLRQERILSETGKVLINDDTVIRRNPDFLL